MRRCLQVEQLTNPKSQALGVKMTSLVGAILAITPLMAILAVLALCAYIVHKEGSKGLRNFAPILEMFQLHEVLKAIVGVFVGRRD
jgi:hypothetical protein